MKRRYGAVKGSKVPLTLTKKHPFIHFWFQHKSLSTAALSINRVFFHKSQTDTHTLPSHLPALKAKPFISPQFLFLMSSTLHFHFKYNLLQLTQKGRWWMLNQFSASEPACMWSGNRINTLYPGLGNKKIKCLELDSTEACEKPFCSREK